MDKSRDIHIDEQRFRNSEHHASSNHNIFGLERRDSNLSTLSLLEKVQMANYEVFSGPIGESVPSSLTSFAHRSRRADSNTSFSIFRNDEDAFMVLSDENAILDDEFEISDDENLISLDSENSHFKTSPEPSEYDLLVRRHSTRTTSSHQNREKRVRQKINIATKDLDVAIVGFQTSIFGYIIYSLLCSLSLGLGYLVLRWIPSWKVLLVGKPCPLYNCDWVVIENQWGEFITQEIIRKKYGYPISTVFGRIEKHHIHYLEDEDPIVNELQMLEYRYMRFLFHPYEDKFVLGDSWKDPRWTDIASIRLGIDGDERESRGLIFGKNSIEIEQKSIFQLLTDEVLHPFYVFQIASLVLWSLDQYYYYALCIFIISLFSIIKTLIDAYSTTERLRNISKSNCDIRVLRNSFWRHVESSELVPGDVFEVTDPALKQLPCDSLLLAGDCIVNESMLTGESVPISKSPATLEALQNLNLGAASIAPEVAKHFLFGGTKIIRAKRPLEDSNGDAVGLAVVVRTGFNTVKGALVRSILFPKPSGFSFYRDSFRYISVMACIACLGFIATLINFIRLQLEWGIILVRALDLITIVVPPALPATLTIGTNFALSRLKAKKIFCISPQRVNVGGKLNIICFDKTGTLTEDGLDVLGIRIFQQAENRLSDLFTNAFSIYSASSRDKNLTMEYDLHRAAIYAMATCHSLRIIDNKTAGDPLDVNMFEFTGWSLEEGEQGSGYVDDDNQRSLYPTVARPPSFMGYESNYIDQSSVKSPVEIGILKTFEFFSHLRRVSVVVREFGSLGCDIYVKGAPECMADICKPETLPPDFEDILAHYTHRGFRVIALATKHIMKLSWVKIQKMRRIEAESELVFIGFLIFENKLKPSTAPVLNELAQADIRKLMCTGDNILTAISVARECNLIGSVGNCFVPHFVKGDSQDPKSLLRWESIDDSSFQLDETTLTPLPHVNEVDTFITHNISDLRDYSIAITGDVFRWVVDFAPIDILHKVLVYGQVFARMSPDDKSELVEKLQSIDYCCGFCGDGANDCGALKAADIGISLSEAEASVAAPLTSQIFDITCVPEVIREGRAALVTSFTCFKYMSLYSAIQFTSVTFLYASASNLGDFQFLFIDLILILPIAIFLGWTKSYPILHPKRPTANLVSGKVLTPLLGQILIAILYQTIVFYTVREQTWFIPPHSDKTNANIVNSENTVLFLLSCFEYIFSGIVLSVGPPFQQTWTRNFPFVITIVITLALTIFLLFNPSVRVANFMELTKLSLNFKYLIFLLGLSYFFVAWLSEKIILVRISDFFRKNRYFRKPAKRKIYKTVLENMHAAS